MAPSNSIFFVQTEINLLLSAMKWSARQTPRSYHDENTDPLHRGLSQLREILNSIVDLDEIEPLTFLSPFLAVIRSEETTGPITGLALTAVDKFLSYGLLDANEECTAPAIEAIAEAVTHARFVGTDPSSDEVVLMKILCVLRTLLLIPAGCLLSNEAGCEIMQSCFRICFEVRLSELLRRTAEYTLMNMVQLLFTRLPELKEDPRWQGGALNKKLKMRKGGMEGNKLRRKRGAEAGRERRPPQNASPAPAAVSTSGTSPSVVPVSLALETSTAEQQDSAQPSDTNPTEVQTEAFPNTSEFPEDREDAGSVKEELTTTRSAEPPESLSLPESASTTNIYYMGTHCDNVLSPTGVEESPVVLTQEATETDENEASVPPEDYINSQGVLFTTHPEELADGTSENGEHSREPSMSSSSAPLHSGLGGDEQDPLSPSPRQQHASGTTAPTVIIPYGLPCVRELLRFLVSLTSSHQQQESGGNNQMNNMMVHMGLSLLTVALETGADNIPAVPSLLALIKNELTKNVMALLHSERLSLFAAALRVCFLLFESMRSHLKFQLEIYLQRLMTIITSESERITFEQREVALESIVQLWRIPGFVTELYLNYDCDLFCSNLFEDLTKLLSKNAFPVKGLLSTHTLSLDALLAVIDGIEQHCHSRLQQRHSLSMAGFRGGPRMDSLEDSLPSDETGKVALPSSGVPPSSGYEAACLQSSVSGEDAKRGWVAQPGRVRGGASRRKVIIRPNRMPISHNIPSEEELAAVKYKKKLLMNGTEKFNASPKEGVRYLQEHGIFSTPLEPEEVAQFLRENPRLDKKMIGEYIGNRHNNAILKAFVQSFNFDDVRIDEALRLYLETFRIPGEAPVIQLLLEHFAEHWHTANGEPFANADAAFTLAYAILMLNTDQHNVTSRKQNIPMTVEGFRKNLKGMNGKEDFHPELLEKIYHAIKDDEIVLPSERVGAVKENYLWKVLLRRGATEKGVFMHVPSGAFDHDLFTLIWGPTVAALSFVFDKTTDESINQKAIAGFRKCAMISAHYGLSDVFDNLVISLCQFTTLLSAVDNPESLPYSFGRNEKARLAAKTVFHLAFRHADILRDGWRNLLDCLLQLYKAHLLPEELVVVEDYISPNKQIRLIEEPQKNNTKQELGMFSTFYLYFTSDSSSHRGPSQEEQEARKRALECIQECHIEQLLEDSKFLHDTSLTELMKALISVTKGECSHDALSYHYDQDARVFAHELLMRIMLQNRDRMTHLWPLVRNHFYEMAICSMEPSFLLERTVVGLLRLAHRLLRRHEMMEQGFTCLDLVGILKPHLLYKLSRHVIYGLHELLQTHAASLGPRTNAWRQIFTLLEVCGAGIYTPPERRAEMVERLAFLPQEKILMDTEPHHVHHPQDLPAGHISSPDSNCVSGSEAPAYFHADAVNSDGEMQLQLESTEDRAEWQRGYTSDSDVKLPRHFPGEFATELKPSGSGTLVGSANSAPSNDWIMVNRDAVENSGSPRPLLSSSLGTSDSPPPAPAHQGVILYSEAVPVNQYSIVLQEDFRYRNSRAMQRAVETLMFLVRDPAYINVANFKSCVRTLRVFVEASVNGGAHLSVSRQAHHHRDRGSTSRRGHGTYHTGNHSMPTHYPPSSGRHGSLYSDSGVGATASTMSGSTHEDTMSFHSQPGASASLRRPHGPTMGPDAAGTAMYGGPARVPVTASGNAKFPQSAAGRRLPPKSGSNPTNSPSVAAGYSASASSTDSEEDEERFTSGPSSPKVTAKASRRGTSKSNAGGAKGAAAKASLQQTMSVQLLDLMYTLHTRAASLFSDPHASSGKPDSTSTWGLWNECWCPLLQSIARLCCDSRRVIRTQALTYLQRALLAPDLQRLTASEWEDCFTKVLFPLLSCLLEDISPMDPAGMEETRMRASTLLSKVFLQHLSPMYTLPTFTALWLTILDFMDKYMHVSGSDLLVEAVPESLKNMLLVMDTASILQCPHPDQMQPRTVENAGDNRGGLVASEGQIWRLTWDRISAFLPHLQAELFPPHLTASAEAAMIEKKVSASGENLPVVAQQPRGSVSEDSALARLQQSPQPPLEEESGKVEGESGAPCYSSYSVVIPIPDTPPCERTAPSFELPPVHGGADADGNSPASMEESPSPNLVPLPAALASAGTTAIQSPPKSVIHDL